MRSGLETLGSIDAALQQERAELEALDRQIQVASQALVQVGQQQASQYRHLAELKLDQLARGPVVARLDDTDRYVAQLLAEREQAQTELENRIASCNRRQNELESDRGAQQQKVHAATERLDQAEAATQEKLAQDPAYKEQLARAQQADEIADHAEAKTQEAETNRASKGKPYESDPLFSYLWRRHYGTSAYRANPLFRWLDGWVARLCKYHDARPNYAMLNEIPQRLREHAEGVRAAADRQLVALRELEEKAAAADGLPAVRAELDRETERARAIDAEIQQQESTYNELMQQRAAYVAGDDEGFRKCLDVLVDQLRREPLGELRRQAEVTATAEDNLVVEALARLEDDKVRAEQALEQIKPARAGHWDRLQELEKVRREFKHRQYDDASSVFSNGAVIGTILNEFLRGVVNSGQLWNVIQGQQRTRPGRSSPTFGSGGFRRSAGGGTWRAPRPRTRTGGRIGGGRFKTGGGF